MLIAVTTLQFYSVMLFLGGLCGAACVAGFKG